MVTPIWAILCLASAQAIEVVLLPISELEELGNVSVPLLTSTLPPYFCAVVSSTYGVATLSSVTWSYYKTFLFSIGTLPAPFDSFFYVWVHWVGIPLWVLSTAYISWLWIAFFMWKRVPANKALGGIEKQVYYLTTCGALMTFSTCVTLPLLAAYPQEDAAIWTVMILSVAAGLFSLYSFLQMFGFNCLRFGGFSVRGMRATNIRGCSLSHMFAQDEILLVKGVFTDAKNGATIQTKFLSASSSRNDILKGVALLGNGTSLISDVSSLTRSNFVKNDGTAASLEAAVIIATGYYKDGRLKTEGITHAAVDRSGYALGDPDQVRELMDRLMHGGVTITAVYGRDCETGEIEVV